LRLFTTSTCSVCTVLLLILVPSTWAEEFGECVPTKTLSSLLSLDTDTPRVVKQLPDNLATLNIPKGSDLVGSLIYKTHSKTIFSNQITKSKSQILTSFVEALNAKRWDSPSKQSGIKMPFAQRGFQGAGTNSESLHLCHKEHGRLNISVATVGSKNYITLARSNQPYASCSQVWPVFASGNDMLKYMPNFKLPADAKSSHGMGAMTSNISTAASDIDFETKQSLSEIQQHFAAQLKTQDWSQDSGWQGDFSAGSSWELEPDSETHLIGTLSIIKLSPNSYTGHFRLTQRER
jgi:hypothetical protein